MLKSNLIILSVLICIRVSKCWFLKENKTKILSYLANNYLFEPTKLPIGNVVNIFDMSGINQSNA